MSNHHPNNDWSTYTPQPYPSQVLQGFCEVNSKTGVADLVILHHSEMFDLFVTPMLQTQTNEVGLEPTEIKKQLASGLFFVCVLAVLGYLGAVWVATRTVRLHAPLGTSPKTLQLPKMPTLESPFHLHEKTGCRFSYEWWLNPRYPSKPNKSCVR